MNKVNDLINGLSIVGIIYVIAAFFLCVGIGIKTGSAGNFFTWFGILLLIAGGFVFWRLKSVIMVKFDAQEK